MKPMIALYAREVKRFQKLWLDTLMNPIVSVGLYLLIFGVVGRDQVLESGIPFVAFVYAGLLANVVVNASFSNPGFALVIAKNLGTFVDLRLAPIPPLGVAFAYASAAVTRSLITLVVAAVVTAPFVAGLQLQHPFILLLTLIASGLLFALLGFSFGMRAKNFESLTFITTFVMQPLTLLSGVFYPIANLPGVWADIARFNPVHHVMNLVRYSLFGVTETPIIYSVTLIGTLLVLVSTMAFVFARRGLRADA